MSIVKLVMFSVIVLLLVASCDGKSDKAGNTPASDTEGTSVEENAQWGSAVWGESTWN